MVVLFGGVGTGLLVLGGSADVEGVGVSRSITCSGEKEFVNFTSGWICVCNGVDDSAIVVPGGVVSFIFFVCTWFPVIWFSEVSDREYVRICLIGLL